MKKILTTMFFATSLLIACTKTDLRGPDDSFVTLSGDDNPHGGGGDNVAASSVPAAVMSAFTQSFPSATRIEWKKNSDGTYKVEFYLNGIKWQVTYSVTGAVLKKESK